MKKAVVLLLAFVLSVSLGACRRLMTGSRAMRR